MIIMTIMTADMGPGRSELDLDAPLASPKAAHYHHRRLFPARVFAIGCKCLRKISNITWNEFKLYIEKFIYSFLVCTL